ncbi:MAG TPA: DNA methyltransferase [Planctomycetota bacterium]|nr:DNA methyltransferase [Planctomycetota bacterium]
MGNESAKGPFSRGVQHIERQIPPEAHTSMYVWHKYWGRKTWNVVGEFIDKYCPPGGIVLDPFAGSGVVAMEALKIGRKVIVCDLLPVSTEIIRLTLKHVDPEKLVQAFDRVERGVKDQILELYQTQCRKCRLRFPIACAIWDNDKCTEIRYASCPRCGDRREKNCKPSEYDLALLEKIEKTKIKAHYPKNRLYYTDGSPFKEKQKYESLDQLFTKRNLLALSLLMEAIEEEANRELRDFLKIAFSSMVHLCSRMLPAISAAPGNHQTSFSSTWSQHSYWHAPKHMEQNVWYKFESSILKHQGLVKAKTDSNKFFAGVRLGRRAADVIDGTADAYIHCGDSTDLMKSLAAKYGPCIDYIFTDPPYDASVQYGELAYLWNAWLGKDEGYVERILAKEVVRNERQRKDSNVYNALLRNSFLSMYDVIKPDRYLTLTFHNPTFKVRNDTIRAGVMSGFDLEKIHHQPLGQKSPKAMLQPFGSAQGDFYLRFYKSAVKGKAVPPETLDAVRFERIVLERARHVLAERGEPTPYTILINTIDPELARHGYFSELRSGLDIRGVLEGHLGREFKLASMQLGGKKGKAWWFTDPSSVPHLETIPLSERVEQTVLRELQRRGRVTFTDMWKAISEEFPNSLTTDTTSIKDALEVYARRVGHGDWLLKNAFETESVKRAHTLAIAILAEIGMFQKYEIWIGRREQSDLLQEAFPKRKGTLNQYITITNLKALKNAANIRDVEFIDVLWILDGYVKAAFEVECSTSMTEALKRCSNVDASVPKFMIIPEEREMQLQRKLRSPLFSENFSSHSWKVIFLDTLERSYRIEKERLDLSTIIEKKTAKPNVKRGVEEQPGLFDDASVGDA